MMMLHGAELQMLLFPLPPLCSPGLVYPKESEFIVRLREMEKKKQENNQQEESIMLIPTTLQELDDMLRLCCHNPINLPQQVQHHTAEKPMYQYSCCFF